MFIVVYVWQMQRAERTQPYDTIGEAVAVANVFRESGFWASVRFNVAQ